MISLDEYFESGLPLNELEGVQVHLDVSRWGISRGYWEGNFGHLFAHTAKITKAERFGKSRYSLRWAIYRECMAPYPFSFTGPSEETGNMFIEPPIKLPKYTYKELK